MIRIHPASLIVISSQIACIVLALLVADEDSIRFEWALRLTSAVAWLVPSIDTMAGYSNFPGLTRATLAFSWGGSPFILIALLAKGNLLEGVRKTFVGKERYFGLGLILVNLGWIGIAVIADASVDDTVFELILHSKFWLLLFGSSVGPVIALWLLIDIAFIVHLLSRKREE